MQLSGIKSESCASTTMHVTKTQGKLKRDQLIKDSPTDPECTLSSYSSLSAIDINN